jgi:hypothetical protein
MATYRAKKVLQLDQGSVIAVESDKTFYRAALKGNTLHLYGPGVDEHYEIGEDIPSGLSDEHTALVAVLLWEDQV